MSVKKEAESELSWQVWTLFFIFLVLKLEGKVNWSWWWISCPIWGGLIILFLEECLEVWRDR